MIWNGSSSAKGYPCMTEAERFQKAIKERKR